MTTLFGIAASHADAASVTGADLGSGLVAVSITPPASMVAGHLVIVDVIERATTLQANSLAVANDGGQEWTSEVQDTGGGSSVSQRHWCRFNGTWNANPTFYFDADKTTAACSVVMTVFAPTAAGSTWAIDAVQAKGNIASGATHTVPSITTANNGAVAVSLAYSTDNNNSSLTTPGNWTSALVGIDNIGGTGLCINVHYDVTAVAGATGTYVLTLGANGPDGGRYVNQSWIDTASTPVIDDVAVGENLYHGQVVVVDGSGFGASQGASTIKVKMADGSPSVTQTATAWSDTQITFTLNSTALPFGSVNVEVVNGATVTMAKTLVSASGYANGTANVTWPTGAGSIFDGASAAVVDGDLYEYETLTDQGAAVEVFPDGTFVISSATGVHKFSARAYDQTDETWGAFIESTITGAESTYDTVYGKAVSGSGVLQTIVLADGVAVPGSATLKSGVALSVIGYTYVCPWPATMAVGYVGGVAIRFDGALIVADEATIATKYYANGIPVSYRGEVSVSLSAPTGIKNGIGRVGDAICVSDF